MPGRRLEWGPAIVKVCRYRPRLVTRMRSDRESTVVVTMQPRSASRTVIASDEPVTAAGPESGAAARAAKTSAATPTVTTAPLGAYDRRDLLTRRLCNGLGTVTFLPQYFPQRR